MLLSERGDGWDSWFGSDLLAYTLAFVQVMGTLFFLESWENPSAVAPDVQSVTGGCVAFLCLVFLRRVSTRVARPPVQCPSASQYSMWGQDSQAGLPARIPKQLH